MKQGLNGAQFLTAGLIMTGVVMAALAIVCVVEYVRNRK